MLKACSSISTFTCFLSISTLTDTTFGLDRLSDAVPRARASPIGSQILLNTPKSNKCNGRFGGRRIHTIKGESCHGLQSGDYLVNHTFAPAITARFLISNFLQSSSEVNRTRIVLASSDPTDISPTIRRFAHNSALITSNDGLSRPKWPMTE
ncbi:uncharacterized protein LOC116018719 [Ipomoea triloba]|uniref:uncharacterized protein LOC116018719 n=1 Tax=Ipomoea triloba TaxID=35885 RepID=UPI00125DF15D|nr:uncharacterized protein LOC116018719 [Ipomoea triloba]